MRPRCVKRWRIISPDNYNRDAWTRGFSARGGIFYNGRAVNRSATYNLPRFSTDRFWAATVSLQADIFCGAVLWAYTSPWAKTPNGNNDTRNRMRNGKRGFVLCAPVSRARTIERKKKKGGNNPRVVVPDNWKPSSAKPCLFVTGLIPKVSWEGNGDKNRATVALRFR